MKVYLARHGDYSLDAKGLDVLSESGTRDIINMINFLKPMNLRVSNIFHSEKYRAQQTAELLTQGFVCDLPPQLHYGLNPNDDVSVIANELTHWSEDVVLVGHLPFMGKLVSQLLTDKDNREIIYFQTSTLVCLDQIDRTRWIINWALSAKIFSDF